MSAIVTVTGKGTEEFHWLKKKKKTVVRPLIGAHSLFLGRKSLLHFTCLFLSKSLSILEVLLLDIIICWNDDNYSSMPAQSYLTLLQPHEL